MNPVIQKPAAVIQAPPVYQSAERVLIFDMNNEYGEYGIKTMQVEHIPAFNVHPLKEIRRIVPFRLNPKNGKVEKLKPSEMIGLLEQVVEIYKNGKLIIEDPSKFMGRNMTDDIIGAICTNRHSSVDVIMHYQSINRPLPVIHENTNIYRFHHQGTDVYKAEDKLEEATEPLKICQILVDSVYQLSRDRKNPCKRVYVYYYKDINAIIGDFSKKQFEKSLDKYIAINNRILKQWLNKRDTETGDLIYTYKTAHEAFKKELFDTYYGNDIVVEDSEREAIFMVVTGLKGVGKTSETMRDTFQDYCLLPLPSQLSKHHFRPMSSFEKLAA